MKVEWEGQYLRGLVEVPRWRALETGRDCMTLKVRDLGWATLEVER